VENTLDFLEEIFKEKNLFSSLLKSKDFNDIFDILISKLKYYLSSIDLYDNKEYYKILLNKIVLLLIKVNEGIIADLTIIAANKIEKNSEELKNNSDPIENKENKENKINNYFKSCDHLCTSQDEIKKKENNCKYSENEEYLNMYDIYNECLPFILQFYTDKNNRPIKSIDSTYKNSTQEILGNINLSIIELTKTIFEIIYINSKNKIFGYRISQLHIFKINKTYNAKLNSFLKVFTKQNFFNTCLEDLLKHEMNNYLQILLASIINNILDYSTNDIKNNKYENQSEKEISYLLLHHILTENDLINYIIKNSLNKNIEFEKSRNQINSGYLSFFISLAEKINKISLTNYQIKAALEKSKFLIVFLNFILRLKILEY